MISVTDIPKVYNRNGTDGTNLQPVTPSVALGAGVKVADERHPPALALPTPEEIKELNIHERISWIIRESRSLPKTQWNADSEFAYAGHDQIVEMLRVLLGKYGVNIYQEALEYKREATMGGLGHFTVVKFEYEVVNINRPDDSLTKHNWGEAWDDSDKGLNKCSTISEKLFLLRLFKVATYDDPDSNSRAKAQHKPVSENGNTRSDHNHSQKSRNECEQCGNPVCGAQRAGKTWQLSELAAASRSQFRKTLCVDCFLEAQANATNPQAAQQKAPAPAGRPIAAAPANGK